MRLMVGMKLRSGFVVVLHGTSLMFYNNPKRSLQKLQASICAKPACHCVKVSFGVVFGRHVTGSDFSH
jgi:hypothetical protein